MISARNQIDVTVTEINKGAVSTTVVLTTPKGIRMYAAITRESADVMQLETGEKVVAFFKSSHVLIATGWAMSVSARNRLEGDIKTISRGAVNTEVAVTLASGEIIKAVITTDALEDLALKENDSVLAIVKASDVMIAK